MVSALFCRKDSIYKTLGVDTWDIDRGATNFAGTHPVITHPPCAQWGRLRKFATPNDFEKNLALYAVHLVRTNGGILEHPAASTLFPDPLPHPGQIDEFGGYSICINQSWFGHRAEKKTLLYIVGIPEKELPPIPIKFDLITHAVTQPNPKKGLKECNKSEREHTPCSLAKYLILIAQIIARKRQHQ